MNRPRRIESDFEAEGELRGGTAIGCQTIDVAHDGRESN